jgi:phage terminase large subunit
VQRSLEQSAKRLLDDKIKQFGLEGRFNSKKYEIETPGDGIIIFQGMQNHTADTIKSLEGFDTAWVEEAQALSQRSLDLLRPTIRRPGSELWFTWNPRYETDAVDAFFRGGEAPPDSIVVNANYNHNPWFPDELRLEMEWDRNRDPDKFAHVWQGQYESRSEARVFHNFVVEPFETPSDARFYFGADWGFAKDPNVLVRMWIKGRTLYIDHEVYKVGCRIEDTPALFEQIPQSKRWPIVADSARPDTIDYMRRHGFPRMEPAKKGKDSIEEGVEFLQSYDIVIHPRCKHTADEFRFYKYKIDPHTDEVLPQLADLNNHVIDSARYALEKTRRSNYDLERIVNG